MFTLGYVTNNDEAMALYKAYCIPYQVMKRSGEVRAKVSSKCQEFKKEVEKVLVEIGAGWMLDRMDVRESVNGYVFIASPRLGYVTPEVREQAERRGYIIEDSGFKPYRGESALVVRKT